MIVTHDTPDCKALAVDFDSLTGVELTTALLRSNNFALAALGVCGVEIPSLGAKFTSPYGRPGGGETAYLLAGEKDGRYLLRCWRSRPDDDPESYSIMLSQLYRDYVSGCLHDVKTGRDNPIRRKVGKVEGAIWIIRLAKEAGFIKLPIVDSQVLEANAPRAARFVYEASELLSRCRLRYKAGNSTFPAARRFLVDWTGGIPESEALSGKRWLVAHGYWRVETVGQQYQEGKAGGMPTLYRFGGSKEVQQVGRAAERKEDTPTREDYPTRPVPDRDEYVGNQDGKLYKYLDNSLEEYKERMKREGAGGESE
ncbi:MAG: hypothetical protein KKA41_17865 [Proteobacteria bacterium]|nr:hypothetical protein [Pseudomonadota bacterium]